jgi:hypothetical protein
VNKAAHGKFCSIATRLKLYNVGLSIDNFGGAHSSLARLRDLPSVELKLDRSYVAGCATDGAKQSVCTAAIELAHGFGLTVCAKGVTNVEDLRTVIELGCHSAQGVSSRSRWTPRASCGCGAAAPRHRSRQAASRPRCIALRSISHQGPVRETALAFLQGRIFGRKARFHPPEFSIGPAFGRTRWRGRTSS